MLIPGTSYVSMLLIFKKDLSFDVWWDKVILFVFFPVLIVATTRFESPKTTRERNRRIEHREADQFATMTPELQQLHIHAKNKVAEFNFNLVIFLITSIASGYLIYLCVK
ncbi:MAG: hypothetical protein KDA77_01655 [Planctomycetaceae bacterium]|nr:hypothetical protein [Planctomycetaceae bacterium]